MNKFLLLKDSFVELLKELMGLEQVTRIDYFEEKYPNLLKDGLLFFEKYGVFFKTESFESQSYLLPPNYWPLKSVLMNPMDLLSLDFVLKEQSPYSNKDFKNNLIQKISTLNKELIPIVDGPQNLSELDRWLDEKPILPEKNQCELLSKKEKIILPLIEGAIESEKTIIISIANDQESVFPFKVFYFEDNLKLIGESTSKGVLELYIIEEIDRVKMSQLKYVPKYSRLEVFDFIKGMQSLNGNEVRLVLKILRPDRVDLSSCLKVVKNPFITANSQGELIWAVNIMPDEELFKWLFEVRDYIDIMDPLDIKGQFLEFCKTTLKLGKVS